MWRVENKEYRYEKKFTGEELHSMVPHLRVMVNLAISDIVPNLVGEDAIKKGKVRKLLGALLLNVNVTHVQAYLSIKRLSEQHEQTTKLNMIKWG